MDRIKEAVEVAIDAALAAGKIQTERADQIGKVRYKGHASDPVTEIDLLCEQEIIRRIRESFPDHDILAEESAETYFGKGADSKWVIDPLDGTLNYSHGYPCYCVSIAVEYKGEIVVGVIYNPCLDELFVAEKGKGATMNSQPISVSQTEQLQSSLLVTGFAPQLEESLNKNLEYFGQFIHACQAVRRPGSAAMDLCYTAMGRFEGFWEMKLKPWDVAAGTLIMQEAGGKVTKFDGSPVSIYDQEILATNGLVHQQMVDVFLSNGNH
jgi:myo-inositol-1(or 4)-monophosphatase